MSKRDDINKAVMGGGAPSPAPVPARATATPFVARIAQAGAQGLLEENRKLKAERSAGRVVLELDPKRVRFGPIANRDERSLTTKDDAFAAFVAQKATNMVAKNRRIDTPAAAFEPNSTTCGTRIAAT